MATGTTGHLGRLMMERLLVRAIACGQCVVRAGPTGVAASRNARSSDRTLSQGGHAERAFHPRQVHGLPDVGRGPGLDPGSRQRGPPRSVLAYSLAGTG